MAGVISIHALLAESDRNQGKRGQIQAISIHALLAESDEQSSSYNAYLEISIHALLAESDNKNLLLKRSRFIFLSTLSLRRATEHTNNGSNANLHFYPRSPCGERRSGAGRCITTHGFLSTLSLRRATRHFGFQIPLPLFLSTLSLRRATSKSSCVSVCAL